MVFRLLDSCAILEEAWQLILKNALDVGWLMEMKGNRMKPRKSSPRSRFEPFFLPLTLSVLLLVGCGAQPAASPTAVAPDSGSALELGTPSAVTPSATQGLPVPLDTPTLEILPTATPSLVIVPATVQPLVVDTPQPSGSVPGASLVLAAGTTAGVARGSIGPGQVITYTLQASQSQPLTLIVDAPSNGVTLAVTSPTGTLLLGPDNKYTRWQMTLPATGLYTIQVIGGATTETFQLTYKLPQRASFASGASSLTVNGTTALGYLYSYALNCAGGQTLSASLDVPSTTAIIDIYGIATGTLLDASARVSTWSGGLPGTQDYIIEVVPVGGMVVNYALTVSCSGTPSNTNNTSTGEITFAQWTTAAVRQGTISPGQVITYTVSVSYAQPLIVDVDSRNFDVTLGILDPNGGSLFLPSMNWTHYMTQAQHTGTYTINVYGGATTEAYTLTTKVGRLMNFPNTYQTSNTYYGETTLGYVQSYAFRCSAGQEMSVSLDVDNTRAYLAVYGIQSGALLDFHEMRTSWSGILARTEEIVVEVIPRGGYLVSYNLTVTIP
jgi:hypothetical protein